MHEGIEVFFQVKESFLRSKDMMKHIWPNTHLHHD